MFNPLKRAAPLLMGLLLSGCGFLTQRGEDFLDIWRADLHAFALPGAWVYAGPFAHAGLGTTRVRLHGGPAPGVGHIYNQEPSDQAACTDVYVLLLHFSIDEKVREKDQHRCLGVLPGLLHLGEQDRPWIHLFDVEVGIGLMFFGVNAGFSPGQFLDFLLGWFGIDLAGDDAPEARRRRSGVPKEKDPPMAGGFPKGGCVELIQDFEDLSKGAHGHVNASHEKGLVVTFSGVTYVVPATLLRAAKSKNK